MFDLICPCRGAASGRRPTWSRRRPDSRCTLIPFPERRPPPHVSTIPTLAAPRRSPRLDEARPVRYSMPAGITAAPTPSCDRVPRALLRPSSAVARQRGAQYRRSLPPAVLLSPSMAQDGLWWGAVLAAAGSAPTDHDLPAPDPECVVHPSRRLASACSWRSRSSRRNEEEPKVRVASGEARARCRHQEGIDSCSSCARWQGIGIDLEIAHSSQRRVVEVEGCDQSGWPRGPPRQP